MKFDHVSVCCGADMEVKTIGKITAEDRAKGYVTTLGICPICRKFCHMKKKKKK